MINKNIAICLVVFFFFGCKKKVPLEPFNLKIILTKSLGNSNAPFPKDLIDLAMPFEKTCKEIVFNHRPDVELVRLNSSGEKKSSMGVDLKSFGGNVNNLKFIGKKTRIELEKRKVGNGYHEENEPGFSASIVLDRYTSNKQTNQGNLFLHFVDDEYEVDQSDNPRVFDNVDSIQNEIKKAFCENKKLKNVYIIYNPPSLATDNSNTSNDIASIFNEVGDIQTDPVVRRGKVDDYLSQYFSSEADIKELGANGNLVGVVSAKDYLKRIAQYKTVEKIEVVKALQNPDGKYWEVQVVEHLVE